MHSFGAFMAPLERKVQRIGELLACVNQLQVLDLHVIPQHQLLGIRMQIHLLVHPLGNRIAVQVMLEPVRSYVSGTISGTSPCR
jgi:hypothetical protein